jgi:hypothetical protein
MQQSQHGALADPVLAGKVGGGLAGLVRGGDLVELAGWQPAG